MVTFKDVLESSDKLSLEDQEALVDILYKRLIERRRIELAEDIRDAQQEFQEGRCRETTPSELIHEILS